VRLTAILHPFSTPEVEFKLFTVPIQIHSYHPRNSNTKFEMKRKQELKPISTRMTRTENLGERGVRKKTPINFNANYYSSPPS